VSISKKFATQDLGVRWGFETIYRFLADWELTPDNGLHKMAASQPDQTLSIAENSKTSIEFRYNQHYW
jgi:hypothetical protein